nr:glycosyltransferase family A protein [Proteus mirabilis]
MAKGEYICFLDSDDTYEPNFLMMLLKETEENNIDFSYCLFNKVFDHNDIRPSKEYIDNNTLINFLNFDYFDICCLLLKKQFIEKHQIKFDTDMIVGEDVWFILQSLYLGKYTCVNEHLYNYYHISTSIMNKKWKVNNYLDEINAWEAILKKTKLNYILTQKDELLNKINIKLLSLKIQFMWKLLSSGYFEYLENYLNEFRYDVHLFSKIKNPRKYKFRLKIIESKSHFLWRITKIFIAKKKDIIEF